MEGASFAVRRHLGDVLIVNVLEIRHFWDIVLKTMVSIHLDVISCTLIVILAISLSECIFLRGDVAVLAHRNHDQDEYENHQVEYSN